MLDAKLLKEKPEWATAQFAKKGFVFDTYLLEKLQHKKSQLQVETETLQARRNQLSKQIGKAKAAGEEISAIKAEVDATNAALETSLEALRHLQKEWDDFMLSLPNLPLDAVPEGKDETQNREESRWGTPNDFTFPVQDHVTLGEPFGMSFERGAQIAGSRFVALQGPIARLHRALAQWMLDAHLDRGYCEVNLPVIVQGASLQGTGQLPNLGADLFHLNDDRDFYLSPTAEVQVTNLAAQRTFQNSELPLRFVCHSPCFRKESGSYGRDTRGMIRNHQFEKVELVHIVAEDQVDAAFAKLQNDAESLLQQLALPYRVMTLCGGDTSFTAAITRDLEVWLPSQNTYREISSCSYFGTFQARRMQSKYKTVDGKKHFVHTLNGSALAVGRTLVAVLENYQQADGDILIPQVIRPYLKGVTRLSELA